MEVSPTNNRPRQFSLLQVFGVTTVFELAFGLWHANSFELVIASAVGLGGSAVILQGSKRKQFSLLLRCIACVSIGLIAATFYAIGWGDEKKLVQIGIAIGAAISCWILMAFCHRVFSFRGVAQGKKKCAA
jgi:uncharacterized membrane protein YhfC